MSSCGCNADTIFRQRISSFSRQQDGISCILANQSKVLLPCLLASHIAIGDEITFPIPDQQSLGAEVYLTKADSFSEKNCVYLAPIGYATRPQPDKRGRSFVSVQVQHGNLGISSVFLPSDTVREYFYCLGNSQSAPAAATLYQTLRIGTRATLGELRVAFKLRALELKTVGAAHSEQTKLERAFNILAHPELRAHYDALLADTEAPAVFPYGAFGLLLVKGELSRDGATFFAKKILAFLPEQIHRRFHMPLRSCDFYPDKVVCRDTRRHLEFWLDASLLPIPLDPSWNRWKHLLSSKMEVDGVFVRRVKYKKRDGEWDLVDCETGLPSRLSIKLSAEFEQDIDRAQKAYSRFGQYSLALDQVRLCLEHKAIERADIEQMCSQLGVPGDFDATQISWRPDYDAFFYRELSRRARRIYLFRNEYIFEHEKSIVVETPQLGHATYVFAKPRDMDNFLARYTKTTKAAIRRNQGNIAERLGFQVRVVHGSNFRTWLREIRQRTDGKIGLPRTLSEAMT